MAQPVPKTADIPPLLAGAQPFGLFAQPNRSFAELTYALNRTEGSLKGKNRLINGALADGRLERMDGREVDASTEQI